MDDVRVVIFDLDGTIYYGSKIIPGANDTIVFLREKGIQIFFVTNNSTKTRQQIYERLVKMGINVELKEIVTSGYIAALYAKEEKMKDIHIFGADNLVNEFKLMGIDVNQKEDADNLLIGYNKGVTYEDMTKAIRVALHAKKIIACNKERTFPGEEGKLFPGCGAMVVSVEYCSNRTCDVVIGKPNTIMIDYVKEITGINQKNICVIGDTYESDIEMAKRAGCKSVLISNIGYEDTIVTKSIADITELFV